MDVEKLISIVRELRPLWDMRDTKYHARDIQRKLWQRVADQMGAKVEEVKKRWRNLRDVFRREHKKILSHRSGDAATDATSGWAFYKHMLFVSDIVEPRELHGNVSPGHSGSTSHVAEAEEDLSETPADVASDVSMQHSPQPHVSTPQSQPWSEPGTSLQPRRPRLKPTKRKRLEQNTEEQLVIIEREKLKVLQESGQMHTDSNYHFLVSLLPFLQNIPLQEQFDVRTKLITVLKDAQPQLPSPAPQTHREQHLQATRLEPINAPTTASPSIEPTPATEPFFTRGLHEFYGSFDAQLDNTTMP